MDHQHINLGHGYLGTDLYDLLGELVQFQTFLAHRCLWLLLLSFARLAHIILGQLGTLQQVLVRERRRPHGGRRASRSGLRTASWHVSELSDLHKTVELIQTQSVAGCFVNVNFLVSLGLATEV